MTDTPTPKGVLAIILVDGRFAVSATSFATSAPGYDNLLRGQKRYAMTKVGQELLKQYGGPVISRLFTAEEATDIAYDIFCGRKNGFEYKEELIGYDTEE